MSIMTVEINDTLHVHLCDGDDPHVLIERVGAALVRIEGNEIRHLSDVLCLVGGDLAALAVDDCLSLSDLRGIADDLEVGDGQE